MDFILSNKGKFTYQGENIRLQGFGVGTWLSLEHFMIGFPTSEKMIHSVFQKTFEKEITDRFFHAFHHSFLQVGICCSDAYRVSPTYSFWTGPCPPLPVARSFNLAI
jgi:hypothetical protein